MIRKRLDAFMQSESILIGHVHDHLASAMPSRYVPVQDEEPRTRSLVLTVNTFEIINGESPPVHHRGGNGHELRYDPVGTTSRWDGYLKTRWSIQRMGSHM